VITLVEGEDAFLRREAVEAAIGDSHLARLDGSAVTLATALDEARTLSIFGGARVVHVTAAAELVNDHAQDLADVAGEELALVLEAEKFDRRRKGMKALLKRAKHVACDAPEDERGLLEFVRRRAKVHGVTFGAGAHLALVLGGHGIALETIDSELAKLAVGGEVTVERVRELVGEYSSVGSFALVDAVAAGRLEVALGLLQAALRDGAIARGGARTRDPVGLGLMLLGALRWDLGRRARERRLTPAARELFARRHAALRETDRGLKSGADPRTALTVLLTRLCERKAAARGR
jgi:DNA polymerase III delta subunit